MYEDGVEIGEYSGEVLDSDDAIEYEREMETEHQINRCDLDEEDFESPENELKKIRKDREFEFMDITLDNKIFYEKIEKIYNKAKWFAHDIEQYASKEEMLFFLAGEAKGFEKALNLFSKN